MGDDTIAAGLPRNDVRIESTLDWYFNFSDADLGLRSNHAATVAALTNPTERTVATSDAAEDAMFRAADAIGRFRAVSGIVNRLSKRDQRDLQQSYTIRRWHKELLPRPAAQRWFAVSSPAVRAYLRGHGHKHWTLEAGERLLVIAERTLKGGGAPELVAVRVDAWTLAERAVEALLRRYVEAERAIAKETAGARAQRRVRRQLGEAARRRWS